MVANRPVIEPYNKAIIAIYANKPTKTTNCIGKTVVFRLFSHAVLHSKPGLIHIDGGLAIMARMVSMKQ